MLRLIAAAVALVLAAAAPLPDGPETGYPGPKPAPAAAVTAPATPAPLTARECVQSIDAPGGVEICVAWMVWGDPPVPPTPAVWPQAYP